MRQPTASTEERTRGEQGHTLIELVVAIGVIAMLIGSVAACYLIGAQVYFTHRDHHEAASQASSALQLAVKDLSDGALVTEAGSSSLTYRKPMVDSNGLYELETEGSLSVNVTAVALGDVCRIYQTGDRIILEDPGSFGGYKVVAENVVDLQFLYDGVDPLDAQSPSYEGSPLVAHQTKRVTMIVTTQAELRPGAESSTSENTIRKTIRLRNHF